MKALILAAGYATRLYPLTLNQPKPLLKVGSKPIIEHIVDKINAIPDIDIIYVVTNNKFFNHFQEWAASFVNTDKRIVIVNDQTISNEDRLGAVGDMAFVIEHENVVDDLFVIAGDNLFDYSLADMFSMHLETSASVVAGLRLPKEQIANRLGNIIVDDNSKIISFEEKPEFPKSEIAATATYLFTKNAVQELKNCINENKKPDNSGDFVRYLANKQDVFTFVTEEKWFDIGSLEQLKLADIYLSNK